MDDVDFATERAESFNASAIQMVLQRSSAALSTGICRSCEADIEEERIQANPHAHLCCDCAEEEEAERIKARRCGPR
jgi:RNA polymerase-binding transcription factor DksA